MALAGLAVDVRVTRELEGIFTLTPSAAPAASPAASPPPPSEHSPWHVLLWLIAVLIWLLRSERCLGRGRRSWCASTAAVEQARGRQRRARAWACVIIIIAGDWLGVERRTIRPNQLFLVLRHAHGCGKEQCAEADRPLLQLVS